MHTDGSFAEKNSVMQSLGTSRRQFYVNFVCFTPKSEFCFTQ